MRNKTIFYTSNNANHLYTLYLCFLRLQKIVFPLFFSNSFYKRYRKEKNKKPNHAERFTFITDGAMGYNGSETEKGRNSR